MHAQASAAPSNWRVCDMPAALDDASQPAGAADHVTFRLPAEPRPATVELLHGAARELQRSGGPFAPAAARHALARELQVSCPLVYAGCCSAQVCVRAQLSQSSPPTDLHT